MTFIQENAYLILLRGCSLVEDFSYFRLCGSAASHANTKLQLLNTSQAAQAHYVWVQASEVIWSEYTRIISVLCQINAKSLKDMKSSCLPICTSSIN